MNPEVDPPFPGVVRKASPAPTQTYPSNGATVKGVPYIQWLPLAYAASYDVQIDNDANFSSPVATVSATKMSAWAYTEPLAAGTYYWRVRRNDADNRDGAWSTVRSFVLAPTAPTLVSPTNGTFPDPATLLLQWSASQPAPSYQVEVSTSATFASFVSGYPQTTVMTSWAPKAFFTNGTYYWRVKARNAAGTAVATSSVWSFKIGEKTPFTDISSSPFKPYIEWVYLEGITSGCSPTLYCPDGYVTREEMASFLARAVGLSGTAPDAFTDDETSIHEPNINLVAKAGIATGCAPGKFCPTGLVSREQMASFLARARQLTGAAPDAFTDDETSIHEPNINLVAREGIATGCGGTKYCPLDNVTRGQMAAFLYRAFSISPTAAREPAEIVTTKPSLSATPSPRPTAEADALTAPTIQPDVLPTAAPSASVAPTPSPAPAGSPALDSSPSAVPASPTTAEPPAVTPPTPSPAVESGVGAEPSGSAGQELPSSPTPGA